ncbi:phosphotransferase [Metabacillus malikii]|uniref:Homoserine kinase type II n=1 Tax=Metabacillus malikii TaxID=1504265 RepID=A0ABT9ZLA0_9BACI|nr:phosphotransferase [Metabacillus malikii]MDQ0232566.1 homoserine kinase type II [Metabacillus malikii]
MNIKTETLKEILQQYFPNTLHTINVRNGKNGYNNTTKYIEDGRNKYVLRIYETHKDEEKVKIEHEVLMKLNERKQLPFNVPKPVIHNNGQSFYRLRDETNKIVSLFYYIDGQNPQLDSEGQVYEFGYLAASLLHAFDKLSITQPFIYRPYYEIENAHPKCGMTDMINWCSTPPDEFKTYKSKLLLIKEQLMTIQKVIPRLKTLPHQIIHGDLNHSNILQGKNGHINTILDFEFATNDLRAMEVAVCLSELSVKEANIDDRFWRKVSAFQSGFSSVMKLTNEEIEVLPTLIHLRRLDVFVHFLGRYLDGIDEIDVLIEQIENLEKNQQWLSEGKQKILQIWGYQ